MMHPPPDFTCGRVRLLRTVFALMFLAVPVSAHAQDSGLSFLALGTDAASLALGDQGVASTSGAFATYWNPAGLVSGSGRSVGVSHHVWIADVKSYAASAVFRSGDRSAFGGFITATDSGDLEAREQPGASDGSFDAQFVSFGASYARIIGAVRAGVTAKFITERIYANSANGFAIDAGVQASTRNNGLLLGAALSNVGSMSALNAVSTKLPRIARFGATLYPFRVMADLDGTLLLNTAVYGEVSHNTATEQTRFHIGLSGEVLDTVTARFGYVSNDDLRSYSVGLGIEVATLVLDYALIPFENGFGGPAHIITLTYGF